jgi:hypothetical protein
MDMNDDLRDVPAGFDRGKEMERQLTCVNGAIADLRLATVMTERLQVIYERGVVSLGKAEELYDDIFRDVLKTDYFNLLTMRGKLLTVRGALGEIESERDDYFAAAARAFQQADDCKPGHEKFDLFANRADLCLYQSDNKIDHASAAAFLDEASDFIGVAVRTATRLKLASPPYLLQVTMGRYYLAEARVHPEKSGGGANAEQCFAGARDGCRKSFRKTKMVNRMIEKYLAIYAALPPVMKSRDPRAALRRQNDGVENAQFG